MTPTFSMTYSLLQCWCILSFLKTTFYFCTFFLRRLAKGASEMAQQGKALAVQSEHQVWSLKLTWWNERTDSCKLSFDLLVCFMECSCTHTQNRSEKGEAAACITWVTWLRKGWIHVRMETTILHLVQAMFIECQEKRKHQDTRSAMEEVQLMFTGPGR